ncbi:MAG: T9SS type A sorting domain-containing protein [Salibacteraceae bacterium]|nr:T9SS type A sorting domain-containing protein [Salibacteraceae bacterium]
MGNYEVCLSNLDLTDTTIFCDSVIIECLPVSANITEVHSGTFYLFESNALNASAYLWDFGDGSALDSTANPTHQFPWFGSNDTAFPCPWVVHLTAYNFCDTIEDFMTIVPEPCGSWNIEEVTSSSEILISPNPSNDIILLTAEQEFILRNIRMINGQEAKTGFAKHAGSQQEINVSALPNGIYLLEYEIYGLIKTQRFVVLH